MRYPDLVGDIARIVNVLPGAAGAFFLDRCTMIVELQRDANHIIAARLQQRGNHRRINAAGHGSNNARCRRRFCEAKRI